VPEGPSWLHEAKYDGYRILARKAGDEVTLFSRSGLDWTVRFPAIANAMQNFPAESALLDGEVAFVLPSGITDFKSLQEHIDTPHPSIRYFVFDLLNLGGKDWRKKTLKERRARLAKLMAKGVPDWLVYADYVEGSGPEFFAQACAHGLEGIMSKRADSVYRSGRGKDWLKIKCLKGEEFVVGGFSRSKVKGRSFSSLLLGTFEDGKLIYSGKVGTGFDSADFDNLARKFKPLERPTSPFEEVPAAERKDRVWLEPKLVAEIAFTERTRDGRLRHPSFKGLREDKPAREVHREQSEDEDQAMATTKTAPAKKAKNPVFAGIALSNPDKVYYPDASLTKLDIARYYETVAPFILPYVSRRPISLVRCPEGIDGQRFFQRHAMKGMSPAIKQIPIAGGETDKPYLYIDDEEGLFGLVQIGTLEIHDWGVSLHHIAQPDRLVFDLDPDEQLDLATLKAAALEVREFLAAHAEARLAGSQGLRQGDCRCARRSAPRPLHREPSQEDARGTDLRRLSAQSARRLGNRQLFDPRQERRTCRLSASLGRAQGLEGGSASLGHDSAGAAQAAEERSLGGILFHPSIDHGKGQEGARPRLAFSLLAHQASRGDDGSAEG
jgi:bifunctional non-homologous end joining protein LigD